MLESAFDGNTGPVNTIAVEDWQRELELVHGRLSGLFLIF